MAQDDTDLTRPARTKHGYDTDDALDALGDLLAPPGAKGGAEKRPDEAPAAAPETSPEAPAPATLAESADEAAYEAAAPDVAEAADTGDTKVVPDAPAPVVPELEPEPRPVAAGEPDAGTAAPPQTTPDVGVSPAPLPAPKRGGPAPLVPSAPGLGLSDLLKRDAVLNVPKWRAARAASVGVGLFGLLLTVIGAARHRAGADPDILGPLKIGHLGLIVAMLAFWAFLTIRTIAGDRVLRVPLAPSQGDQWEEAQSQARLMQFGQWIGAGGSVVGLIMLALSLRYLGGAGVILGAGLGATLAVASLILVGFMEARRGPLRVVYVQTLLLSRLEQAGVSEGLAMDPRTAQVLQALDKLLADLPESSVRRFLSSQEAQWYLDLIESTRGGPDG